MLLLTYLDTKSRSSSHPATGRLCHLKHRRSLLSRKISEGVANASATSRSADCGTACMLENSV